MREFERADEGETDALLYPSNARFDVGFNEAMCRQAAQRSNADPIPRALSLDVRFPMPPAIGAKSLDATGFTRERARADAYVARLVREVDLVAGWFDRDRSVVSCRIRTNGGNVVGSLAFEELVDSLRAHFHCSHSPQCEICVEADARRLQVSDVDTVARLGINAAVIQLQCEPYDAQPAHDDALALHTTLDLLAACHAQRFVSTGVELICAADSGPGIAEKSLSALLLARPSRLAVRIARDATTSTRMHGSTATTHDSLESRESRLVRSVLEPVTAAGYQYLGLGQFVLASDSLWLAQRRGILHYGPAGYSPRADIDEIGLGVGATSRVGDCCFRSPSRLPAWEAAVDAGRFAVESGVRYDFDDHVRSDAIDQLLCCGAIDIRCMEDRHGIDFEHYFSVALDRLAPLVAQGDVVVCRLQVQVNACGRERIRSIAACFDRIADRDQPCGS